MEISQGEYVQRIAEAGLLDEYRGIFAVVEEGVALESQQPEQAAKRFLAAYRWSRQQVPSQVLGIIR